MAFNSQPDGQPGPCHIWFLAAITLHLQRGRLSLELDLSSQMGGGCF